MMPDREKVVKHFEYLLNDAKGDYQDFTDLTVDSGEEILALLKEQQARKSKDEVLTAIISSQGYTDVETFKRTVLEIDNFEDDFLGGLFMAVKAVEKLFDDH